MGQNIRAVEQIVLNLQNQQIITPDQSQNFLKDYQSQNPILTPVYAFISKPNLAEFLKYYIYCKYKRKYKSLVRTQQTATRHQIQNDLSSLAEIELKEKIAKYWKNQQKRIKKVLKIMCKLLAQDGHQLGMETIKRIVRQQLGLTQYKITQINAKKYKIYQSQIDHITYKNTINCSSLTQQNINLNSNILNIQQQLVGKTFKITFRNKQNIYQIQLNLHSQRIHSLYRQLFKKEQFKLKYIRMLVEILECYEGDYIRINKNCKKEDKVLHSGQETSQGQNIGQFQCNENSQKYSIIKSICILIFQILQLSVYIFEQDLKQYLKQLFNIPQATSSTHTIVTSFDLLQHSSSSSSILKQKSLCYLQQKYNKIQYQLKQIQKYKQYLIQNKQFMCFDKYLQLHFYYLQNNQSLVNKIEKCWAQNRINIIDIMGDQQQLLNKLKQLSYNRQKPGTQTHTSKYYTANLHINKKSILQTIQIIYNTYIHPENLPLLTKKHKTSDLQINKQNRFFRQKKLTSKMQTELLQDLEKQNPNIKVDGWVKLFIKEPQNYQSRRSKLQLKWSVIDMQKTQTIDYNLNILKLTEHQLTHLIWDILKTNTIFTSLLNTQTSKSQYTNFIKQIKQYYSLYNNKYHNFYHAVHSLHMCSILLDNEKIHQYLSNLQIFAIFISALCHDIGHTGNSNVYEIATLSDKAITYNDLNPLQNYHAATTFKILKNQNNNFLSSLSKDKFINLKQSVINNILNTDMNEHFNLLQKFTVWTSLDKQQAKKQPNVLTSLIVHASDFASTCKDFQIAKEWAQRLNMEFKSQVQNQKKLGINISQAVFSSNNFRTWIDNQVSYLKVIVLPMYRQINHFCQDSKITQTLVQKITSNIEKWVEISHKN